MLLLIKGRLFLILSLLFSMFIYKMGNSIEAPLYHSTWNGMIQRITNGVTPTYLYCVFAFSVNLSYCCLLLLLYMLSIFSVILFSCRHYGIVGREALCCLCLINHIVVVVVKNHVFMIVGNLCVDFTATRCNTCLFSLVLF